MTTTHRNRLLTAISNTPGAAGALTIATAASGYRTFAAGDDGLSFDVSIVDGTSWEIRTSCVYTHAGTSLSRGTLEDSSTGSAITLTSAAVVTVTATASLANALETAMQGMTPGGRLTLESGVPVSTTDQTAKTTIYYTPYVHNTIPLWDGVQWVPTTFTETSLSLGTLTSGLPYDIFGYLSAGQLALELLAWTNDTTRATEVTPQDGRYCKSGDKTRLLLGTIYTTSTTTTEDSAANRYVGNLHNSIEKPLSHSTGDTGHTYSGTAQRPYNNATTARISMCACIASPVTAFGAANLSSSTSGSVVEVAVGVDSTTVASTDFTALDNAGLVAIRASASGTTTLQGGKHYVQLLERSPIAAVANYSYGIIRGSFKC